MQNINTDFRSALDTVFEVFPTTIDSVIVARGNAWGFDLDALGQYASGLDANATFTSRTQARDALYTHLWSIRSKVASKVA